MGLRSVQGPRGEAQSEADGRQSVKHCRGLRSCRLIRRDNIVRWMLSVFPVEVEYGFPRADRHDLGADRRTAAGGRLGPRTDKILPAPEVRGPA